MCKWKSSKQIFEYKNATLNHPLMWTVGPEVTLWASPAVHIHILQILAFRWNKKVKVLQTVLFRVSYRKVLANILDISLIIREKTLDWKWLY